jgi:uncharacterized protein
MNAPLRIWILNDQKAGHHNQSRALALAFGQLGPVEVVTLRCKLRAGGLRYPLRWALNLAPRLLPLAFFRLFHSGDPLPSGRPDILISAGGHTTSANAWIARQRRCDNLFCGRTRGLRDTFFSGLVTPFEQHSGDPRYIVAPTPVPINPADLAAAARTLREQLALGDTRLWSLLVGGEGAGYHYDEADWRRLAAALAALAERHGIRWLLATSRRTGAAGEALLASLLDGRTLAAATYAFDKAASKATYQQVLGAAERHFCTEDSHMMMSESIATGRPVHTLQPARFKTDPSNQHFIDLYAQRGYITRHDITDLATLTPTAASPTATEGAPSLAALAERLKHWRAQLPRRA